MSNANASYQSRSTKINAQIAELQVLLAEHNTKQTQKPTNWGMDGDLRVIEAYLAEAITFLKG